MIMRTTFIPLGGILSFQRKSFTFLLGLALASAASAQIVTEQTPSRLGQTSFSAATSKPFATTAATQMHKPRLMAKRDLIAARRASLQTAAGFAPQTSDLFAAPDVSKALDNPNPVPKQIIGAGPNFFGFSGLTAVDNANANGSDFEPPDQGLGVGNGFVLEAVNLVFSAYDTSGNLLLGPAPANAFFGLAPFFDPVTKRYGPSLGDPRAYFDQDIQRWFLTILEFDVNPKTGDFTGRSHVEIAVSTDSLPFIFNLFAIDTTDDGTLKTPAHPGCPCYPDQPLIGADKHGFYISTNEYSVFGPDFNGTQIYAMSKAFLAEGALPTVVHFSALRLAEGVAYSVQPALSLGFHNEDPSGVEYFLSSLDFQNTLDNRIAVWQLRNTVSLGNLHPNLKLSHQVIASEVYGIPPPAVQPSGPFPLGASVKDPLEMIDSNDDRMNQVVFENGKLWSGVDTIIGGGGTNPDGSEDFARAGIAYFVVDPASASTATIAKQGYVAAPGDDSVIFPAIGVTPSGKAAMVFTLVGPTGNVLFPSFYPSVAFTTMNLSKGAGNIQLGAAGFAPDDGFTGYSFFGGNGVGRWGDYSAAVADTDGSIWMATEWIPGTPPSELRPANWGTFIGRLP